jgi:hypothetical protein
MRSSFAVRTGLLPLGKTPNVRQQAQRRRLMVICAMLGLALVSGVIGTLSAPRDEAVASAEGPTGPFSYFPTQ